MAASRIIAQLSDTHIVEPGKLCMGTVDTADLLRRAIATIAALDPVPDVVICTGDLVNSARLAQYEHLAEILATVPMPVYLLCGNHDDRDALRQAFPDHTYLGTDGPVRYVVDQADPLRVIALDTVITHQPSGVLDGEQLAWLDEQLAAEPQRPTLIAMHHPPFSTGIGHMDAYSLDPASCRELAAIIGRHPHVERVLCGHLHRSITRRFAGTVAMTVPSSAHAVALDLDPTAPPGAWTEEPPAVTLHHWRGEDAGLVTHIRPIGDFPPHPFHRAASR